MNINRFNETLVYLSNNVPYNIRIRAYNEGIAFRYGFKENKNIHIKGELTEFSLPPKVNVWTSVRAQSEIKKCLWLS